MGTLFFLNGHRKGDAQVLSTKTLEAGWSLSCKRKAPEVTPPFLCASNAGPAGLRPPYTDSPINGLANQSLAVLN